MEDAIDEAALAAVQHVDVDGNGLDLSTNIKGPWRLKALPYPGPGLRDGTLPRR